MAAYFYFFFYFFWFSIFVARKTQTHLMVQWIINKDRNTAPINDVEFTIKVTKCLQNAYVVGGILMLKTICIVLQHTFVCENMRRYFQKQFLLST